MPYRATRTVFLVVGGSFVQREGLTRGSTVFISILLFKNMFSCIAYDWASLDLTMRQSVFETKQQPVNGTPFGASKESEHGPGGQILLWTGC